jgi:hypothetical protein
MEAKYPSILWRRQRQRMTTTSQFLQSRHTKSHTLAMLNLCLHRRQLQLPPQLLPEPRVEQLAKPPAGGKATLPPRRQSPLPHQPAINHRLMLQTAQVIARAAHGLLLVSGASRVLAKRLRLKRGKRTLLPLLRHSLHCLSSTSKMARRIFRDLNSLVAIVQTRKEVTIAERAAAVVCHGTERTQMQRLRKHPLLQRRPQQTRRKAMRNRPSQLFAQRRLVRSIHQLRDFIWQAMLSAQRPPSTRTLISAPLSRIMSRFGYQAIFQPRRCSTMPWTLLPPERFLHRSHLLCSRLQTLVFGALLL